MLILVNGKIPLLNRSGMLSNLCVDFGQWEDSVSHSGMLSNLCVDFGQWEDSVSHSGMMSNLCVCETSTIRPPCISRSRMHVCVCVCECVYVCV